jgi:hypothetical protein
MNVRIKLECLFLAVISTLVQCLWLTPGAYLQVEHLKNALLGLAPALPTNIRLSWKGSSGTNTLEYYVHLESTAVKSFITLAPGREKRKKVL